MGPTTKIIIGALATALLGLVRTRLELAALDYSSNSYLGVQPAVALAVFQLPQANALTVANDVKKKMKKLKEKYPNDRAALQQATMELYRKHKINPLGGCLPIATGDCE
mgnify:CR=1 FL=1